MEERELRQLKSLKKEADEIQVKIDDAVCFPKEKVSDTANDYRTGYKKTIVIEGYGDEGYRKLQQKRYEKWRQIHNQILEMEEWLDSIEDSEMRRTLRLYYEEGLTQEEVGERLFITGKAVQKRLERFWKQNKE